VKKILLTFSAALFILNCNAQITFQKTFGGLYDDDGKEILQTADGGYVIGGSYYSAFYLFKTDVYGEIIWSKVYADTECMIGNCMDRTLDGGYVVAGFIGPCGGGPSDVILIKVDSSGNLQWSKRYGTIYYDRAYDVQQTNDGGYIMVGSSAWTNTTLLIKVDSIGNLTWAKESINAGLVYCVQQTNDNGYIISGEGFYLLKTDSYGNAL